MTTEEKNDKAAERRDDKTTVTRDEKKRVKRLAKLIFLHGFSDHCNAYYTFFPSLAARGIEVFAFDQRGWGRSVRTPSDRGASGPTSQVLADLRSILSSHIPSTTASTSTAATSTSSSNSNSSSNVPIFLMGHSMGAGEILSYAARGDAQQKEHIRGYLAEAPLFAFPRETEPWKLTVAAGRLMSKMTPGKQLVRKLEPALMSRDPVVCSNFAKDPLCHDTGTLEGLAGMLQRTADLRSGRWSVPAGISLWVGHGTEDKVTSFEAAQAWVQSAQAVDKTFRVYRGWYHKLHAEPGEDHKIFAKDVADWILARCNTRSPRDSVDQVAPPIDIPTAKL
ncbi:alpha/beta-hydrolase [Xylona heveae TC161]|uniref:Alpha/beta-hydrolase n=1 Tax=Xylona heveae (strain CBS 132557 / TC161) TaxID=1328760 RepID=A0A165IKG0_XYLHT|nr:alpha/beta-hydrolase [Xylona heveae TC161]KZF25023.1 alpha/beta-hydrolase [Xylona heveae TC161]